jgi:hypothetical protein
MVLDIFLGFIQDQIKVLSAEEKVACNSVTIAKASLEVFKNELEEWLSDTFHTLNNLRLQKSNIASALKRNQSEKKNDLPVTTEIENILLQYNISAAAYHGGKLNGVDCQELICLSKPIKLHPKDETRWKMMWNTSTN